MAKKTILDLKINDIVYYIDRIDGTKIDTVRITGLSSRRVEAQGFFSDLKPEESTAWLFNHWTGSRYKTFYLNRNDLLPIIQKNSKKQLDEKIVELNTATAELLKAQRILVEIECEINQQK